MNKTILGIMAITSCLAGCTESAPEPEFKLQAVDMPLSNPEVAARVDSVYAALTMEERLAQLHGLYMHELFTDGKLDDAKCRERIANGIGHFSQYAGQLKLHPDKVRDMVAEVQTWILHNTKHPIPALCHDEIISGMTSYGATTYPQQIGQACSFNTELAEIKTQQSAATMRKIGGAYALSPMVDVDRNPFFNRNEESYGEDGYLSAAMGVAFVRGLQHGGLENGVAACTKHFLGYGGGAENTQKEIMEEILLPHEAMIRIAGSKTVMTGYHEYQGMKCVGNPELQEEILRTYLGWDGVMVSDYGAVSQLYHLPSLVERAAAAINAGNDVEFPNNECYQFLPEAISKGLVSEETFERAVKRVLTLKARLGFLDFSGNLYDEGHIEFDTPEERETAYKIASQSVVLLQNNGILPLRPTPTLPSREGAGLFSPALEGRGLGGRAIFLTGPNANNMWAMLGDYTYQGMAYFWRMMEPDDVNPRIVNLHAGLRDRLPEGFSLDYERGCDWTEKVETDISAAGDQRWLNIILNRKIDGGEKIDRALALKKAAESDVIIAAMGENTLLCGENRDRGGLRLPGSQEAYVEELLATGKPVILVLFGGRCQIISKFADRCAAIIQGWYPGEEGGNALADIIFGNIAPSGKLSVSYPNVELNENICYNYSTEKDPRVEWPFGFGLSYTTFEYSNLEISEYRKPKSPRIPTTSSAITIAFDVKNTGEMAADEIVQLYLSPIDNTGNHKPIQLCGFGRVSLQPGETKRVEFLMSPQQFGYYSTEGRAAEGHWNIAPGKFSLKVGASSQDIRLSQEIELTGEKQEMPLRTIYFSEMQ